MDKSSLFKKLKAKLAEKQHVENVLGLLEWDTSVNMPPKGSKTRGESVSILAGIMHEKSLDRELIEILEKIKKLADSGKLNRKENAIFREEFRVYQKKKKLPADFVKKLAATVGGAHHVWVEARKKSKFGLFAPTLKKIVELKREQAKHLGYGTNPYDAMLDDFEPGLKAEEVSIIFAELKDFLVSYIKRIQKTGIRFDQKKTLGRFDLLKQKKFNQLVAQKLGYDLNAGRLDESDHPFSASIGPGDVRITSRYRENDILYSLGSTIHETGHALYDQGLNHKHFGNALGQYLSLAVHESQSRVWENMVGQSLPFWKYFYPILQKEFPEPFRRLELAEFYKIINRVEPSLIRVESDEVTYNLHIIIRFEIEKELIEGSIDVKDLPKIWNFKYKDYLGVKVPGDDLGVLQDVHWSAGLFGYFPTYALGNLYSAQFYAKAKSDIMNLEKLFEKGKFLPFLEWLRKNIHQHGRLYSADELVRRITGEPLNPQYYIDYITGKFNAIYNLK